jgi:hypothetical protein
MNRIFTIFLTTLAIISLLNNNCFSQENESELFTKLALLKGKVVDKNGHGIPMVMILIYGTPLGGISNQMGHLNYRYLKTSFLVFCVGIRNILKRLFR